MAQMLQRVAASAEYTGVVLATRWIATALFIVAVPLFLLLTNVRVAASEPRVFGYSYSQYGVVERTGIDRVQLDLATNEIVDYFRSGSGDELLDIRVIVDGEPEALYSQREVLHMRDVKDLFQFGFRLQEITFAYVVTYVVVVFLWIRERTLRDLARQAMLVGGVTVALLGAAAVGVLVGFDSLFEQFHLLSFSNDFWKLNPATDRLVQMFPFDFWFDVTLAVGVITAIEGGLVLLAGYGYLAWEDHLRTRWQSRNQAVLEAATSGD
jgi:integral membrane protein (TIGR01906 family)